MASVALRSRRTTPTGTTTVSRPDSVSRTVGDLSGEVDYTYSHEIDITSTDDSGIDNPFNIKYMKGSGGFDRRQILSMNYIYKLPIFRQAGFAHSILGGWELAGTIIDETGVPTTPRISLNYDTIGLGGGYTNRPNQSAKSKQAGKHQDCL